MKVKEAIEVLRKLDPEADIVVASMGHGGSVPLQAFEAVQHAGANWVDVIYCEDHERQQYGLSPS